MSITLTDAEWKKISSDYVPEALVRQIEERARIAGYKLPAITIEIPLGSGEYKSCLSEKLNEHWAIAPNWTGESFHRTQRVLTHIQTGLAASHPGTRTKILKFWEKIKDLDIHSVDVRNMDTKTLLKEANSFF